LEVRHRRRRYRERGASDRPISSLKSNPQGLISPGRSRRAHRLQPWPSTSRR
jgi:hypothetical protein